MNQFIYSLLLSVFILASFTMQANAQWGDFEGQFVYDGDAPIPEKLEINKDIKTCDQGLIDRSLLVDPETKGIKNIVVYVRSKIENVHPSYEKTEHDTITLEMRNCCYEPHILLMRTNQALKILNSDPIGHNANVTAPIGGLAPCPLLPPNATFEMNFTREQRIPIPTYCNVHPWMKSYVLPRNNPYSAVTNIYGKFIIKNLPVGKHEIQIWHEKPGYFKVKEEWVRGRFTVEIKPGNYNTLGVVKVSPELFED